MFHPTFIDIGLFIGTLGIFFTLFLLFARVFPVIAQSETKSILKEAGSQYYSNNGIAEKAHTAKNEEVEEDQTKSENDSSETKTEDE